MEVACVDEAEVLANEGNVLTLVGRASAVAVIGDVAVTLL